MFWKLCKFELRSSYRMYMMFYAILLICSVIIGMSSLPEIKLPGLLKFLIDLTIVVYTASIFAIFILTIVFIFRNYNQTLYKQQAYLTHAAGSRMAVTAGKGFICACVDGFDFSCDTAFGMVNDALFRH